MMHADQEYRGLLPELLINKQMLHCTVPLYHTAAAVPNTVLHCITVGQWNGMTGYRSQQDNVNFQYTKSSHGFQTENVREDNGNYTMD